MTRLLLLDMSAWARLESPRLTSARRRTVGKWLDGGRLAVCLPFLLEAGYSARSAADRERLLDAFEVLLRVPVDAEAERRALSAQTQLARVGHHRLPPPDLIVAALADRHRAGILHYDADFDLIRERTDLEFESEWLAPRGTL